MDETHWRSKPILTSLLLKELDVNPCADSLSFIPAHWDGDMSGCFVFMLIFLCWFARHRWTSSWCTGLFPAQCIWRERTPKASGNRFSKEEEEEKGSERRRVLTESSGMPASVPSMAVQKSVIPPSRGPLSAYTIESQRKSNGHEKTAG